MLVILSSSGNTFFSTRSSSASKYDATIEVSVASIWGWAGGMRVAGIASTLTTIMAASYPISSRAPPRGRTKPTMVLRESMTVAGHRPATMRLIL